MSEPMTERNPADVLADRLDELRREMELRFSGLFVENAVNRLSAAANFLRQPTQTDALKMALGHIEEHIAFAETRIQDGKELGATVWRIALEDMVRESRDVLAALEASNG